jgi:hypothetical protein
VPRRVGGRLGLHQVRAALQRRRAALHLRPNAVVSRGARPLSLRSAKGRWGTYRVQDVLEDALLAAELEQVAQRAVGQAEAAGLANGGERGAQREREELAAAAARQAQLVTRRHADAAVGRAVRRHQRHVVRHAFVALQLDHAPRCRIHRFSLNRYDTSE